LVRARTHALTCTLQSCMHVHTTKLHAHAHYKSCMHMHTTKLHAHAHYKVACTCTLRSCMHMHTTKLHAHAHYRVACTGTLQSCMHMHTTKVACTCTLQSCMHMHTTELHAQAHYRVACTGTLQKLHAHATLQSCMHMHTTKLHAHAHYKSYMHITNDKDRQNYPMFWPLLSGKLKALLSDPQAFVAAKAISKSCNCKHLLNVTNFLPHNHTGSGHSPTN